MCAGHSSKAGLGQPETQASHLWRRVASFFVSMWHDYIYIYGFPGGSDSKLSAYNAGYPGSIPGLGRSPGEGNGNPIQYSCLENPMDGGAW